MTSQKEKEPDYLGEISAKAGEIRSLIYEIPGNRRPDETEEISKLTWEIDRLVMQAKRKK